MKFMLAYINSNMLASVYVRRQEYGNILNFTQDRQIQELEEF